MTDFITRGVDFNIFAGCGSTKANGGFAAINAAGLGGATDKVPDHVYMVGEADPSALEYLWSKTPELCGPECLVRRAPPKSDVKMILDLLTGKAAYNQAVNGAVTMVWFSPNCATNRPLALDQFKGVEGFTVPDCKFDYAGND